MDSRFDFIGRFSKGLAVILFLFCTGLTAKQCLAATHSPLPASLPAGPYHTLGSQIVDQNGNPVRLSCAYWQGMNTMGGSPRSLTAPYNGFQANMYAIAAAGFDCVRLDWNNRSLHAGDSTGFIIRLDQAVAAATNAHLKMILTDHDNEGLTDLLTGHDCASQQHNGIWYDLGGASDGTDGCGHPGHTTQEAFQADWSFVANRYASTDTVIGYELWNEPFVYGRSSWGDFTPHDIRKMFQDVGSAMLAHNPGKLIFAECPQNHGKIRLFDKKTISYAPWGDCTGARYQPVVFTVNGKKITNQVVYDVHCYPSSTSGIANIFGSSAAPGIVEAMNASFGFLVKENIAPVWDGEGGTGFAAGADDTAWGGMIVKYLNGELGALGAPTYTGNQQGMGFSWMMWGMSYGNGGDNVGIVNPDGSLAADQFTLIQKILFYPKPSSSVCVPSPDGSYVPKGTGTVIDSKCNLWTIAPDGRVAKDGMEQVGTSDVIALGYHKAVVTAKTSMPTWYPLY